MLHACTYECLCRPGVHGGCLAQLFPTPSCLSHSTKITCTFCHWHPGFSSECWWTKPQVILFVWQTLYWSIFPRLLSFCNIGCLQWTVDLLRKLSNTTSQDALSIPTSPVLLNPSNHWSLPSATLESHKSPWWTVWNQHSRLKQLHTPLC